MKDLAEAMVDLFSWVKETEGLDHKLQHFRETIEFMAQQTTECALFIKNYASRGFLGSWKTYHFVQRQLIFGAILSTMCTLH